MSSKEPEGLLSQQLGRLRSVESFGDLTERQRTVLAFAGVLIVVTAVHTVVYWYGMVTFENEPQTISRSLVVVIETFSTVGFGGDSPWRSTIMNLYVVWLQLVGLGITLVTLRLLIIPLFERAPVVLDTQLTEKNGHVVVCGYDRGGVSLLDELDRADTEYVLVDPDKEEAIDLSNRDYQVIDGDPTTSDALARASIADAACVVTDIGDRNVNVALTARQETDDARLLSITGERSERAALEAVGVDRAIPAPAIVGCRLADRLTPSIDLDGSAVALDGDGDGNSDSGLVVRELVVRHDDSLHGTTIEETPVGTHPRLSVVAAWLDGDLRFPPALTDRLPPSAVLLVAGPEGAFEDLADAVGESRAPRTHTEIAVVGVGESGRAAIERLPANSEVTTIDREERSNVEGGVDVVGDATDPDSLAGADVGNATALVVTVGDDDTALTVVALARSLLDDTEIFVRVTDAESVRKAFDAGADYVLSERRVIARTVPAEIDGRVTLSTAGPLRLVRASGEAFAGRTPSEEYRSTDGERLVVGVERDGRFHADEEVEIEADDAVLVAGTDEAISDLDEDNEN